MKRIITSLTFTFVLASTLFAQDAVPIVSNVNATLDTAANRIDISFDLNDPEASPMEVWIQASADTGKTWIIPVTSVSGDTGFPVNSGSGKSISWTYDPDTLAAYGMGLTGFRIRVIADDRVSIDLSDIASQVDSSRVLTYLTELEGIRHRTGDSLGLERAKDSIEARMDRKGLNPVRVGSEYTAGSYWCENIVGFQSGTRDATKTWLINGHYDTVSNSPGVDDNATGIVTVLEALNILSQYRTKHSLRFVNFDLEELSLFGSKDYIAYDIPDWEEMQGLLNMDMVGYYSDVAGSQTIPFGFSTVYPSQTAAIEADSARGNFLLAIANTASLHLDTAFQAVVSAQVPALRAISFETPGTGTSTPDFRRSDHAPFWDAGIPAIFFTDGANFRNPNYHTPNDTLATVHIPFLLNNIRAIVTTMADLAGLEHSGIGESNEVLISLPAGIQKDQISRNSNVKIYPNPGHDLMHFEVNVSTPGKGKMEIIDSNGKLIMELFNGWMNKGMNEVEWQVSISHGHYFFVYELNGQRTNIPFVIGH